MSPRLYRVEASYTYFVVADDEYKALDHSLLHEAVDDAIDPDCHVAILDNGKSTPSEWFPQSLVYTLDGEEITLHEARRRFGANNNG